MDPIAVLQERDPVRIVVIEAIIKKAEDVDRQRQKSLAGHIAEQVLSGIKIK